MSYSILSSAACGLKMIFAVSYMQFFDRSISDIQPEKALPVRCRAMLFSSGHIRDIIAYALLLSRLLFLK